jgi:transcriptional regulator with XRE-family HTH domain
MSFGMMMKQARTDKGLTQHQLAEETGISLRTIQRIENEEVRPSMHSIQQIEKVLGVDLKSKKTKAPDKVFNFSMTINIADMQQLLQDLKSLIKNNWKLILGIVLLIVFVQSYPDIKAGIIDGWKGN